MRHRPWVTTRAFSFYAGDEPGYLQFTVPAGYHTDLGTIPRPLWGLLPPDDPRFVAAFVGHDFLCDVRGLPRLTAAALFLEMCLVLARKHGAPLWRVWAMTAGVTLWALLRPYA